MAIIDVEGTTVGGVVLTAPLAVSYGLSGTAAGGSVAGTSVALRHLIRHTLVGASNVSGSTQHVFSFSGLTSGSGTAIDARVLDVQGIASGGANVTGALSMTMGLKGYALGSSVTAISAPEPIYGIAVVTGFLEKICVPYPVCQTPQVQKRFRWGHQFGIGDLEICVTGKGGNPLGPVCITYTLHQIQKGCAPKQVGPFGRKPGNSSVGCYYATGTAGECGQPGLWLIRWRYQKTFGDGFIEKDCYFYVLDSVLCPVPGDTLPRACKYGWD
jgi:hypothetical protein